MWEFILKKKKECTIARQKDFRKRRFQNLKEVIDEFRFLFQVRNKILALKNSKVISPELRERLMLVVTEVNQCRYCSYAHTKMALRVGLTPGEINYILDHDVEGSPKEEIPAILYAQHWAANDGHPDEESRRILINLYGSDKTEMIDIVLRLMRFANLIGNSLDYLLFKVSFGYWGNKT
jgi:AhpD family alkylhydroperoxidase